jgi:BirA family biotin operon repressor/biotin-[acetyl-CoA-carboxylase] ligase
VVATELRPLDVDVLRESLRPPWTRLDVVAVTSSTNADLLTAAASTATGTVLAAEEQQAGRGRLDRAWTSPPGSGLTFSVLLRPSAPRSAWGWLPLLSGLAVCDAVAAHTGLEPALKWPNDVLIGPDERKLAGILAQVGGDAVVIGIGLNVNAEAGELPVPTATSLRVATGAPIDRSQLLCEVLGELGSRFELWDAAGGDPNAAGLAADYRERCTTLGRQVTVIPTAGARVRALAVDVDDAGALVLQVGDQRQLFAAGDVEHVR